MCPLARFRRIYIWFFHQRAHAYEKEHTFHATVPPVFSISKPENLSRENRQFSAQERELSVDMRARYYCTLRAVFRLIPRIANAFFILEIGRPRPSAGNYVLTRFAFEKRDLCDFSRLAAALTRTWTIRRPIRFFFIRRSRKRTFPSAYSSPTINVVTTISYKRGVSCIEKRKRALHRNDGLFFTKSRKSEFSTFDATSTNS